jgi:hypothetical protein
MIAQKVPRLEDLRDGEEGCGKRGRRERECGRIEREEKRERVVV